MVKLVCRNTENMSEEYQAYTLRFHAFSLQWCNLLRHTFRSHLHSYSQTHLDKNGSEVQTEKNTKLGGV